MVYFHPWEIDPGQPQIRAGGKSTFRHYVNLFTMEQKIERLLRDFRFTTLSEASTRHPTYSASPAGQEHEASIRTMVAGGGR